MYKVGSATRCTSADNCWPYDLMGPYVPILLHYPYSITFLLLSQGCNQTHLIVGIEKVCGVIITLIWMCKLLHGLSGQPTMMKSLSQCFDYWRRIWIVFERLFLQNIKMNAVLWSASMCYMIIPIVINIIIIILLTICDLLIEVAGILPVIISPILAMMVIFHLLEVS